MPIHNLDVCCMAIALGLNRQIIFNETSLPLVVRGQNVNSVPWCGLVPILSVKLHP